MSLRDRVQSMLDPIRFGGARPLLVSDIPEADEHTHSDVPAAPPRRGVTTDHADPRLGHGANDTPVEQNEVYLVLSDAELRKGFVRPVRTTYVHATNLGGCGGATTMGLAIAETYARDPHFYGATYCCRCRMHRPVGPAGEFVWQGTTVRVGT